MRQTSRYGVAEVYGYLGVWARHAKDYPSGRLHKQFKPSLAQIRSYIDEMGWIL